VTLATGARLASYEILAPLGAGGMGEVYRAKDGRLGREVALKVLPEEVSREPDKLARFEQEARSASALNHPNIITVYEIGQSGETPYIAMELVEGKTLRDLAIPGPLPLKRVVSIGAQAAEGLAKAHAAGIVHRDLKPENVMISKDGYVKILDFGLSKLVTPELGEMSGMPTLARPETHPGTVLGTVAYMSPEQASGQPVDFRSDQFTLGAILYEITSGEKAFQQKTAAETMSSIIRDEPKPLSQLRADAPVPLRWIVERCLAKDPEERYASTRDLARDLASVRDHISEVTSGAQALAAAPVRVGARSRLGALFVAGALLAAGVLAGWIASGLRRPKSSAPRFHRLSFRPGTIGNARFTPDGQTILYGAVFEGENWTSLYQTSPESPESRRFEFPNADILSISPSGELALLLGQTTGRTVLARVPLTGGAPREILDGITYANADWGPDGNTFAVARQVEGEYRLEYPVGKVLVRSRRGLSSPRFSPSGDRIAYFQFDEGAYSIAFVAASGGKPEVLSTGWVSVIGVPAWRPDGREVWFTASRIGEHVALYAARRSEPPRLVTRVPGDLELDDISRDGRVLVGHHTEIRSVLGASADEWKERDLSWLDQSRPADLSSDGRQLVLFEEGEGGGPNGAAYLRPLDGSPAIRLGDGQPTTFSPDGKRVATVANLGRPGRPHLVLLPVGAGEPSSLANDTFTALTWADWMPDGKTLVISAVEPGRTPRLYLQDIAGGKPQPISPEGTRLREAGNHVSPDGRLVVGMQRNQAVLVPVQGGSPRPVPGLKPGDLVCQWSTDGRSLYVYRRGEVPARIFLLDVATGERRLWKEIRPANPQARGVPWLLVSPGGNAYVYGTSHVTSELYLIEGLM
jgi:Tol biopolymer transport system component